MTKRYKKRIKAQSNSSESKHTAYYFTVGGNGINNFGMIVAPPRSMKAGANHLRKYLKSIK